MRLRRVALPLLIALLGTLGTKQGRAEAAAIITIAEIPGINIAILTEGIPDGVPGISIISSGPEFIHFTYDDGIPSAVTTEIDVLMLEKGGQNAPSDLFAWFGQTGSSVEEVFFFSDPELPPTCTPSPICTVLPPVIETGQPQTLLEIHGAGGALLTQYRAVSDVSDVPEPATIVLLTIALVSLSVFRHRGISASASRGRGAVKRAVHTMRVVK
jgi:hypothetical protein